MAKIDAYLRSIEKFGAAGAVLTSGQAITLKFPGGDRNATQLTPHDQLVGMVREIAPPTALDMIDQHRPARFDVDSAGVRYSISVAPRPGAWQVSIEPAGAAAPPPPSGGPVHIRPSTPAPMAVEAVDMSIERGQYDGPAAPTTTSGSAVLDQLTRAARAARATDLYLSTGVAPLHRIAGDLVTAGGAALDADALSRELGIVAPAVSRAAWTEQHTAVFAYGDGAGRVRVTLGRDHRGPNAALRLLPDEAPPLDRLNLPAAAEWLAGRGLILVTGAPGAGKTVTLGALVRALGERQRRVVTIEDPIELVHTGSMISLRAVGEHVPSVRAGVIAAMAEGADAIVVGAVTSPEAASAVLDAVLGGNLVLTTVGATTASLALDRLIAYVGHDQRDLARTVLETALLGTIRPVVGPRGARSFDTQARPG